MDPLNILFVSAEVAPFSKTGGLGDVSGALPRYLARRGHDVRVFTPLYSKIQTDGRDFQSVSFLKTLSVALGGRRYRFRIFTAPLPKSDIRIYFVDCPALFHRPGIYTQNADEPVRFALLTHAALLSAQSMGWAPDIAHANDWHTALMPFYLKWVYAWDAIFRQTRSMLTIHNIAYQGVYPSRMLGDVTLADRPELLYREDLEAGHFGFLKTGLLYADAITTVSRTYAREIQSAEQGRGLDAVLRARTENVFGIVNGVDYEEWDPAHDRHIPHPYTADDLAAKKQNTEALCRGLGLSYDPRVPVLGIVSRLTAQKGVELLFETIPQMLRWRDARLAVLGSGESHYEEFFHRLQADYPGRVVFWRGYNEPLSHLIEAGADIFLMPSQFEPCGLNQMYSLRYGTPPVVRRTGGLADTVTLWNKESGQGTGFLFDHFNAEAMRWALTYAMDSFADSAGWERLQKNGMSEDWSWEHQILEYERLYARLAGRPASA